MIKYDYILNSFRQRIAVSGGGGGPTYKKTFTTDDRYTDGWEPYTPWQGTNGLISGGYWTGDGVNPAIGIKRPGSWNNGFVEFSVSLGGPKEGWDNMSAWIASNVISGSRVGSIDVRNLGNNLYVVVRSGNVLGQELFSSWIPYVDNDPIILRIEMVPLLNGTSEVRYKKDGVTLATEITSNAFIDPQVGFFTEILAGQQNKVNYVDYDFQPYPVPAYKKTFATDDRYTDGFVAFDTGFDNGTIANGTWISNPGDQYHWKNGIYKDVVVKTGSYLEASVSLGEPGGDWSSVDMGFNNGQANGIQLIRVDYTTVWFLVFWNNQWHYNTYIPVPVGTFNKIRIEMTPTQIEFSFDGVVKSTVQGEYNIANPGISMRSLYAKGPSVCEYFDYNLVQAY